MPRRVSPDSAPLTEVDWRQAAQLQSSSKQDLLLKAVCMSGLQDSASRRLAWPVLLGCWDLDVSASDGSSKQLTAQEDLYMQIHATILQHNSNLEELSYRYRSNVRDHCFDFSFI